MKKKKFVLSIIIAVTIFYIYILHNKYINLNEYDPPDSQVFSNLLFHTFYFGDYSSNSTGGSSYFFDHSGFFAVFLTPFFLIVNSPFIILFLNALLHFFSAYFLYQISKKYLTHDISVIFVLIFVSNIFFSNFILTTFKPLKYAMLISFIFLYFYINKKYFLAFVFFCILLSCREEMVWIGVGLAVHLILTEKKFKYAALVILITAVFYYYYYCLNDIPKRYNDLPHSPQTGEQLLKSFLLHSNDYLKIIFSKSNLLYLAIFSAPLLYLHFLKPYFFLVYFIYAAAMLIVPKPLFFKSDNVAELLKYPYTGVLLPFLFTETILNFKSISKKIIIKKNNENVFPKIFAISMLVISLLIFIKFNNIRESFQNEYPRKAELEYIKKIIPGNETVFVSWSLCNYFSFFRYPYPFVGFSEKYELSSIPNYMIIDYDKIFPHPQADNLIKMSEYDKMQKLLLQNKIEILFQKESLFAIKIKNAITVDDTISIFSN